MAELIFKQAQLLFETGMINVHSIEINETCTSGITLYRK
ncbi:MAG: hypothetical protein HC906_09080 [Bacteroidales bacterium]|nr:hypothetical protein [Bacteroidales bacterium]